VRTWADISRAGVLLGYRPTTTLAQGVPRFVEWFRRFSPAAARP
jgi:UDP-glucuronate 4-epimerase